MKKLISIILVIVLLALSSIPAFAANNDSYITGTAPMDGSKNFYYTDSYFGNNASVYLPSFSTMSLWLSVSTENELLSKIGFTGFAANDDYYQETEINTMGVAVAYKTITVNDVKSTVVAIVPRGCGYGLEWGGNFLLGSEGEAEGFAIGASKVQSFVNSYISKNKGKFASNIKLWIVGYSRAAAVANLVAGHYTMAGSVGGLKVSKENIYAYTFETPNCTNISFVSYEKAKSLTNIHNIISSDDLVTKVAPEKWGFFRYGVDEEVIPDIESVKGTDLYNSALSFLPWNFVSYTDDGQKIFATEKFKARVFNGNISALAKLGSWKKVDGSYVWEGVDINTAMSMITKDSDKTMTEFWDDAVSALSVGIGSRKNYANNAEAVLSLIFSESLGGKYSSDSMATMATVFFKELQENKLSLIVAAATLNKSKLTSVLQGTINSATLEAGMDSELYTEFGPQLINAVPSLVNAIIADVTLYGGAELFSFIDNYDILFNPHYPQQCAAWLMAQDSNYNPKADSAKVKSIDVKITTTKTTKKVLFVKKSITTYNVQITPVSDIPVQKVEYRTSKLTGWTTGDNFSQTLSVGKLFIRVTDANGRVTEWEYKK